MKLFNKPFALDLQLFATGAGGTGGGSAGAEGTGVTAADAGQQNAGEGAADAGQQDTGVTAADAGQNTGDPEAEFQSLIQGKFKQQYDARMQSAVTGRLKASQQEMKAKTEQLQKYEATAPVFQILAQQYGLEATDLEGITKAIQEDQSFVEEEAFARGMDPKDLMQMKRTERENALLRQQMQSQQKAQREAALCQQAQQQVQAWEQEAEKVRQIYPTMDLRKELENEQFTALLQRGFSVESAYKAVHVDEILRAGMEYAGRKAAQSVTDSVIAGQSRPLENGTSAQGAAAARLDPSKMTGKEIDALWERAARGERVTF